MPRHTIDGIDCYYEEAAGEEGREASIPVVCVHGWGASWKFWRATLAGYGGRRRVLAPDLPGFGDSEKPRVRYSLPFYVAWLHSFLQAFGLKKIILFGHSMGSMIASLFASRYPDLVERLVLVSPPIHGKKALYLRSRIFALPVFRWLLYLCSKVRWMRHRLARDFSHARPLDAEIIDDVAKAPYRSLIGNMLVLRNADISKDLEKILAPTLVVGGTRDRVIKPAQFPYASERIPDATLKEMEETGHCPMLERPEEFHQLAEDFVGEAAGVQDRA